MPSGVPRPVGPSQPVPAVHSAVPPHQGGERIRYLELACRMSDLIIVDEADRVQAQLEGAAFIIIYNAIATFLILKVISIFVPLRMSDAQLAVGDDAVHGETAYAITVGEAAE